MRMRTFEHCVLRRFFAMAEGTSCEPGRCTAYDEDLRWRVVYQRYGLSLSFEKIAANLNIDKSTACRVIALFDATGNVKKAKHPSGQSHHLQKMTEIDQFLIIEVVVSRPGIYLHEIQEMLLQETGTIVSLSTVCNFLHRMGFTRQKMTRVAIQRSDQLRVKFMEDVSLFNPEMFVFIDESGADRRDCLRKFGYQLRGKPPQALQFFNRGKHITAVAAMSVQGLLECTMLEGGVCGSTFKTFLEEKLSPLLQPFNGTNPHSVIILDNASIHHADHDGVVELLQTLGVLVYFLPPYSPDYNPIEELFAKVKSVLKAYEHRIHESLETLLLMSFLSVTPEDCQGWIEHAGYS